ncbi:GNAT family N-acetyltransferase [Nostoc sp. FACHB-892]|uniref:GNAT family N-acetyltransferase n=1 Tax=Nostoc sp. FACHB-892 TaxID=2692843 RepID=UPI001682ACFB|nr:GNAT family N-acetyltransferase [Nostoc sp. FACHB-892]MBD2731236.1 GNAT family N-acetyltransferase [Nostoc sp. FACHB-892]
MQVELIETHRLRGERVRKLHCHIWLDMGSNPEVMATLGGTWSREKAQEKMRWNCEQWERYGHGQWMFFDKATEAFVGRGGIRRVIVNANEEVELGYALMPEFWGKGLAVEIGKKVVSIAFDVFCYPSVVCYTLANNKKSEKVMQKIGFSFEGNITHANMPHVLYRYRNPSCSAA